MCVLAHVTGNHGRTGDLVAKRAEEPAKEEGTYVAKTIFRIQDVWKRVIGIGTGHHKKPSAL